MSRLVWILPELKKKFGGKFYITPAVKFELVNRPIKIRRFQFEALQVMKLIREGVLEVYKDVPQKRVVQLQTIANSSFAAKGKKIELLQEGELQSLASCLSLPDSAIVMDERTLRLFIENSGAMKRLLKMRFKKSVQPNREKIAQFTKETKGVTIIRSIELAAIAYKLGLLESYIPRNKRGKETLIESILWATKYNGCAVTEHEVEELKHELLK